MKLTIQFHLSTEVKNALGFTSTPQYAFMAWCSVNNNDDDDDDNNNNNNNSLKIDDINMLEVAQCPSLGTEV
jgi:hypothetical protein